MLVVNYFFYFYETDGYKSASIDIAIAGLKVANCEFNHLTAFHLQLTYHQKNLLSLFTKFHMQVNHLSLIHVIY